MPIRVTNKTSRFTSVNERVMETALEQMSLDVEILAVAKVPYKGGDLQRSVEHKRVGRLHHRTQFNEDYAAYQERGKRRDGTRVVRRYTTPGTGKGFLKGAGQQVDKQKMKYVKQAANNARMGV